MSRQRRRRRLSLPIPVYFLLLLLLFSLLLYFLLFLRPNFTAHEARMITIPVFSHTFYSPSLCIPVPSVLPSPLAILLPFEFFLYTCSKRVDAIRRGIEALPLASQEEKKIGRKSRRRSSTELQLCYNISRCNLYFLSFFLSPKPRMEGGIAE